MPVTQREYLLTHLQTGGSQGRQEDDGKGIKPIPPRHKRPSEPTGKTPEQHFVLQREVSRVHTGGLTQPWSLSACPDACFCSTKEESILAAAAGQGRSGEAPRNKWFQQLLETPKTSSRGWWARSRGSSQPSLRVVLASTEFRKTLESAQQPHLRHQKL